MERFHRKMILLIPVHTTERSRKVPSDNRELYLAALKCCIAMVHDPAYEIHSVYEEHHPGYSSMRSGNQDARLQDCQHPCH